ncbi:MAG: hypothetical protein NT061_07395 [Spirochaetes bacterium]|nr:hypothetical protein [Spirochaetota bacterium]
MKNRAITLFALAFLMVGLLGAQPMISQKQDVAIFALGYYGWSIPAQALASIDGEIQKVFADLGRFTVLGVSQRLSSGGLERFIDTMKQAKQANFVMPEKYQFGEAFLTQAEFNKLVGAFIVVAPVVVEFNSFYNSKNVQWETSIKTNVTFIDVAAGGSVLAMKTVSTSGTDKQNQFKSISSAISSIPGQLQYEVRSIPEFQINTRILTADGSTVKLQLGDNMGIKKGDEYAVIQKRTVEGFDDSKEAGLIVVKEVGQEVSSAQVLYSSIPLGKDAQLREIPRQGVDFDLYIHSIGGSDATVAPGFKATASRGFYSFRPFVAAQVPLGLMRGFLSYGVEIFPVNVLLGGEMVLNMGRLSVAPSAALGVSYYHVTSSWVTTDTNFLSHVGAQVGGRVAYLFNRNMRAFVDLGYETWIAVANTWGNTGYGGVMFGAGVAFKL